MTVELIHPHVPNATTEHKGWAMEHGKLLLSSFAIGGGRFN